MARPSAYIAEDHPLNAQSPYAATKVAADQIALSFHNLSIYLCLAALQYIWSAAVGSGSDSNQIGQIAAGENQIKLGLHPTWRLHVCLRYGKRFYQVMSHASGIGEVTNIGMIRDIETS